MFSVNLVIQALSLSLKLVINFSFIYNILSSIHSCQTPPPPTPYSGTPLVSFSHVGLDEILCLINSLANKQCSLDPIPTWLFKKDALNLAPFLVSLFNKSLSEDVFVPSIFQDRLHNSHTQNTKSRLQRHQLLPPYIQPVSYL